MEILSHAKGVVNLERVQAGACPFLADHDTSKLIGKVMDVQLDGQRATATIKMGASELAREILKDMEAGIRTEISIGYQVNKMELIGQVGDEEEYLVTDWTLLHVASVAEPADITVGLGRSIEQTAITQVVDKKTNKGVKMEENSMKQSDIENILALGKIHKMEKEAMEALRKGSTTDAFRQFVLEKLASRSIQPVVLPELSLGLGFGQREIREYSLFRAIEALASGDMSKAGFEVEAHRAIEKKMGPTRGKGSSLYVPFDALVSTRALTTSTQGAAFVSPELRGDLFIPGLRNQSRVIEAGATIIQGLTSDIDIPRQSGTTAGYWIGEGADATESTPTYDNVSLEFKTVAGYQDITRKQRIQSCLDVENLLRQDLTATLGIALDLGAINGTGLDGQPTGIMNVTGIGAVTLGAGPAVSWDNVIEMESDLATANTLTGRLGYMFPGGIMKLLKQTERTSGNGRYLLDLNESDKLNGYPWYVTNQVPAGKILFGNWADLLIGIFGPGVEIQVDPYSLGKSGGLRVIAFLSCDVALRNATSFTLASV